MILSPDGNNGEFIDLQVDGLEYQGPMDLTQYFIRTTGISMSVDGSISVVVVLGRRLLGTLLTVYIPTMLLVTISYSTNFFKAFFFEAVVAVNLTCMLVGKGGWWCQKIKNILKNSKVLATMFVSVSDSLPKTSYIKMVDVWLITSLLIPFFEVYEGIQNL